MCPATTQPVAFEDCQAGFLEPGVCQWSVAGSTICIAGVMDAAAVASLKEVSGSQGLMLESTSLRLLEPGGPHHNCPDKVSWACRKARRAGHLMLPA